MPLSATSIHLFWPTNAPMQIARHTAIPYSFLTTAPPFYFLLSEPQLLLVFFMISAIFFSCTSCLFRTPPAKLPLTVVCQVFSLPLCISTVLFILAALSPHPTILTFICRIRSRCFSTFLLSRCSLWRAAPPTLFFVPLLPSFLSAPRSLYPSFSAAFFISTWQKFFILFATGGVLTILISPIFICARVLTARICRFPPLKYSFQSSLEVA